VRRLDTVIVFPPNPRPLYSPVDANIHQLQELATLAKNSQNSQNYYIDYTMKKITAKDAKNGFGKLIDTARAEPVTIEKHGRPVVVVLSIEEYERLRLRQSKNAAS